MEDFIACERSAVRELSCRLCLCCDVVDLKPLSAELKRKLRKLFNVHVRSDDNLPKAICHDCLQQIGTIHRYTVKVEKTQNFLKFFHDKKTDNDKTDIFQSSKCIMPAEISIPRSNLLADLVKEAPKIDPHNTQIAASSEGQIRKRTVRFQPKSNHKRKTNMHREAMSLEEFVRTEGVDQALLSDAKVSADPLYWRNNNKPTFEKAGEDLSNEILDPIVLVNGRPLKQGAALDKQITLFFKMECMICHEAGFTYKGLMRHYKEGHGVPGYVTCCEKKFHHFSPKKIVEHMAYHLQPNVFMCGSCHENFQSSLELTEHCVNGGRTGGRLLCSRCGDRYPTWRELGRHLLLHRATAPAAPTADAADGEEGKQQCDNCGKWLKHHHRKKTVNGMEGLILCTPCTRALKMKAKIDPGKLDFINNRDQLLLIKSASFGSNSLPACGRPPPTQPTEGEGYAE